MSSLELPYDPEVQSEICLELGLKLKEQMIALQNQGKVFLDDGPVFRGLDYSYSLLLPFLSHVDGCIEEEEMKETGIWVAELGAKSRSLDFGSSNLFLSKNWMNEKGTYNLMRNDLRYTVDFNGRGLVRNKPGPAYWFGWMFGGIPPQRNQESELQLASNSTPDETTSARILLEDALTRLG